MRLLVAALLACCVLSIGAAWAASAYDDVPTDHWAYNALDYLTQRGVLEGYPDGFFKGDRTLTRYEFAQAIARLLDTIGKTERGRADQDHGRHPSRGILGSAGGAEQEPAGDEQPGGGHGHPGGGPGGEGGRQRQQAGLALRQGGRAQAGPGLEGQLPLPLAVRQLGRPRELPPAHRVPAGLQQEGGRRGGGGLPLQDADGEQPDQREPRSGQRRPDVGHLPRPGVREVDAELVRLLHGSRLQSVRAARWTSTRASSPT